MNRSLEIVFHDGGVPSVDRKLHNNFQKKWETPVAKLARFKSGKQNIFDLSFLLHFLFHPTFYTAECRPPRFSSISNDPRDFVMQFVSCKVVSSP